MSVGVPPCPFPVAVDEMERSDVHEPMHASLAKRQVENTRCYWAICRCSDDPQPVLSFVYVDPRAYIKVGTSLYGTPMLLFVHPDEQMRVMDHINTIIQDQTLFGRVIQCRYASLSSMPAFLRGVGAPEYDTVDVTVSRLDEQLALCFFHATDDASHACGLAPGSFQAVECQRLWESLWASCLPTLGPVSYVFQILSSEAPRSLLMSWPPPHMYYARDFVQLVKDAASPEHATCMHRLRASHVLISKQSTFSVTSVLVPCASIVLACFQIVQQEAPRVTETPWSDLEACMQPHVSVSRCTSCGKTDSPEWRRGPSGQKTLCNACGLRYARSLANRQRRNEHGTMAAWDFHNVPPSRGSGGGSMSGVHRRSQPRWPKSAPSEQMLENLSHPWPHTSKRSAEEMDTTVHMKPKGAHSPKSLGWTAPLAPPSLAASRTTMVDKIPKHSETGRSLTWRPQSIMYASPSSSSSSPPVPARIDLAAGLSADTLSAMDMLLPPATVTKELASQDIPVTTTLTPAAEPT